MRFERRSAGIQISKGTEIANGIGATIAPATLHRLSKPPDRANCHTARCHAKRGTAIASHVTVRARPSSPGRACHRRGAPNRHNARNAWVGAPLDRGRTTRTNATFEHDLGEVKKK